MHMVWLPLACAIMFIITIMVGLIDIVCCWADSEDTCIRPTSST